LDHLGERDPRVAERFRVNFIQITQSLQIFPSRGPVEMTDPRGTLRRIVVPRFYNYLIFYRVEDASIDVIRVLHGARDRLAALEDSGDL
jgi:plasmid stabilization system protein ParE